MKRISRKPFNLLSKRQQLTRINERKNMLIKLSASNYLDTSNTSSICNINTIHITEKSKENCDTEELLDVQVCFKNLPKDSRTLLKTDKSKINFMFVDEGIYWHIGFGHILKKHLLMFEELPEKLEIEISTDGLSLTRSDPNKYWPIQYRIINIPNFKPLIAGVYKGHKNPSDAHELFKSFIDEAKNIMNEGGIIINGKTIPCTFTRFIGDAPARALVLNHKSHSSMYPCSKCKVEGVRYENRTIYLGIDFNKRTDQEYSTHLVDSHQKGRSVLEGLGIPLVTRVPFEIMHSVYLGITLRCLDAWLNGKFGFYAKLDTIRIKELCSRYDELNLTCTDELARRPGLLKKFTTFKATQLRHFLLYVAPVILKGILPDDVYFHFLQFNIAMRKLTSKKICENDISMANNLLRSFVKFALDIYSESFNSYNVHALLHLADDAKRNGPLESCSAFIYENNMPLFKRNIRNHPKPLQQFARRLQEKKKFNIKWPINYQEKNYLFYIIKLCLINFSP